MATSILSPLAKPFHPTMMYCHHADNFVIFNDGVPSCVPLQEHDIIRGVSDEAIEYNFPPSIEDVAEMEETDFFVQILADLDLIEEREEKSREFADVQKRWSTRRKEGIPVGSRPREARSVVHPKDNVSDVHHVVNHNKIDGEELVKYDHMGGKLLHHHGDSALMSRDANRASKHQMSKRGGNNNKFGGSHGFVKPIQQPRK